MYAGSIMSYVALVQRAGQTGACIFICLLLMAFAPMSLIGTVAGKHQLLSPVMLDCLGLLKALLTAPVLLCSAVM